jgi:hypothetical protein
MNAHPAETRVDRTAVHGTLVGMTRTDALNAISDALVDAHYWEEGENLPGSEVLAEIAVQALERAGLLQFDSSDG